MTRREQDIEFHYKTICDNHWNWHQGYMNGDLMTWGSALLQALSAWEALESMGVTRDLIGARSERWGLTEDTTAWNPHHWDRYSFRSRAEARASHPQPSLPRKPKGSHPSQSHSHPSHSRKRSGSRIDLMAAAAGRLTSLVPLLEKVVQQEEQGEGSSKRFKKA